MGGNQVVLGAGNSAQHCPHLVYLIVELQVLDDRFYETFGVGGVVYGEAFGVTQLVGFGSEYLGKDRVKSSHAESLGQRLAYRGGNALLHFASRLVGKGEG